MRSPCSCAQPRYLVLAVLGGAALALSAGYIAHYLRGGPRVIDATSYWLQAQALSEGYLSFPIDEPTASVRGRFLLTSAEGERLGVIFPPGYPALLALGFWFEHPLWVGPVVGRASRGGDLRAWRCGFRAAKTSPAWPRAFR